MHELKEFVDHSFEELPVSSEKAWILANNVHNVGGYDGLVVLPSLLLAQTQKILRQKKTKNLESVFFFYTVASKLLSITVVSKTAI